MTINLLLLKSCKYFFISAFIFVNAVHANELDESNTAVIINDDDPLSVRIGGYYVQKRAIPEANIIHVRIGLPNRDTLPVDEFKEVAESISKQTGSYIQAYFLTWTRPYRVGCMSVTSAISLGFDPEYCAEACRPTKISNYYNSSSRMPFKDHGIRPSMLLATDTFEAAKKLIDRGIASDYSRPVGDVYLLNTSDKERNVRSVNYPLIMQSLGNVLDIHILNSDWIKSKDNILFYFTGLKYVPHLDSVKFLPGAAGDHLTSAGGVLDGNSQMRSTEWLAAGATASYGTVVEPCNYLAKFPNPGVLMQHYLNGDTLIEAYWKSVAMPGQGVFIGEPLASPFKGCRLRLSDKGKAERLINKASRIFVMRESARCSVFGSLKN